MDELEKNRPDDFWRKAFDEAAETPPPRVWDAIERRLDEPNDTKILPLWGTGLASSRPLVWSMGLAASVALLLIGWWAIGTSPANQHSRSVAQRPTPTERVALRPATPVNLAGNKSLAPSSPVVASVAKPSAPMQKVQEQADHQSLSPSFNNQTDGTLAQLPTPERQTTDLQNQQMPMPGGQTLLAQSTTSRPLPLASHITASSFASNARTVSDAPSPTSATGVFKPLSGKSLRLRELGPIHRMVWFRPTELPVMAEVLKSKHKNHDVWASAGIMPGAFNPMVSVQTMSTAGNSYAMDLLKGNSTQKSVNSRANLSVAYQAGAGVQLTEHWSLESGIGYLAGRSTVETPAQLPVNSLVAIADRNATSSTLYGDALRNSIHPTGTVNSALPQANFTNSIANTTTYYTQTRQTLTNDYQYMQMPVQVGYQLRPRKRLGLALLGGLITNIFVRNTVGNEVVVTAKDGVYRPVSFAATMGARLRYRPSGQWSASLAGVYQPSLGLGTQPDSQVQSHPTSAGMSFGVDYHF